MNRAACVRLACAFVALAAIGCRDLPEIGAGACGNRVIESGETCDGVGVGEARCRPPGAAAECHLDCSVRTDGTRPTCPAGSGCDSLGVCRNATGRYTGAPVAIAGNAFSVAASDFDGDGRADVVSQEAAGAYGATKLRVHYFDREASRPSTWVWPRAVLSIGAGQISGDALSDIVFADGRVGLLLGQPDRALISETYPTYFLPNGAVRVVGPLFTTNVENSGPLLIAADAGDAIVLQRPASETAALDTLARIPGHSIADFAGELVAGDVFDADPNDPCTDGALALRGTSEAHVFSVCRWGDGGEPAWRVDAGDFVVPLDPPAAITAGPLLGDVDGDGHVDLMVGTESQIYVAFGDGHTLAAAKPYRATLHVEDDVREDVALQMPLAIGDFTGDARADFVYPSGFYLSMLRDDGVIDYRLDGARLGAAWTTARVGDLNGNGKLDVIAASRSKLDIDFFNGTGTPALTPFVISTARPVQELAVGDIDGDLIDDLTYLEVAESPEPNEVTVAFGNPAGPPGPGVTAARARDIQQIGALAYEHSDRAAEMFVVYSQTDLAGESGSAFAWLTGFDRSLVCLVELTTFSSDGSIESMPALTVTLGSFTAPGARDVVSIASPLKPPDEKTKEIGMWLVPDMRSRIGQPEYLGWNFDADVKPLRGVTGDATSIPDFDALLTASDFDGDGIDELVLAAPSLDEQRCLITISKIRQHDARFELSSEPPISLDQQCFGNGQIAAEDLDGDGAPEIVLLTGRPGGARALRVFWNDGAGHFAANESQNLARGDAIPQAFTLYRPTPNDRVRVAYVTEEQLHLRRATRHTRNLEDVPGVENVSLAHATGIAAGDVDGDGIADLIIADSGSVKLFRAELEP